MRHLLVIFLSLFLFNQAFAQHGGSAQGAVGRVRLPVVPLFFVEFVEIRVGKENIGHETTGCPTKMREIRECGSGQVFLGDRIDWIDRVDVARGVRRVSTVGKGENYFYGKATFAVGCGQSQERFSATGIKTLTFATLQVQFLRASRPPCRAKNPVNPV